MKAAAEKRFEASRFKLEPHNYASHLDILLKRIRERAHREQVAEASVAVPARRVPSMTTERRMESYQNGFHARRAPTGRQLRRIMRKAGILDPAVALAHSHLRTAGRSAGCWAQAREAGAARVAFYGSRTGADMRDAMTGDGRAFDGTLTMIRHAGPNRPDAPGRVYRQTRPRPDKVS